MSFEEQVRAAATHGATQEHLTRRAPQVSVIRESVAAVYEAEESWTQAAQVLAGIDLDSGQRQLDAAYKLQKCIKIAQLFLVRARQRRR